MTDLDRKVEKRPSASTEPKWQPFHGGADEQAEALKQAVLNTKDELVITGTTYYVSPYGDDENDGTTPATAWRTTDGLVAHRDILKEGDGVLFERGYIYRYNLTINAVSGVSYGAYGQGSKPCLYGSHENYALRKWELHECEQENIWKIVLDTQEGGIVVFDNGVAAGTPKYFGIHELVKNGDFYHDLESKIFYMYMDKGNPASVYEDIEIGTRNTLFQLPCDSYDVTIDNLAFKYCGLFAVSMKERTRNTRITNCEMGWIGGGRFMKGKVGLGNAISYWKDTYGSLVENCWLYQCYDAGITPQGTQEAHTYKDLVFRGNLIEYCNYNIEVFDRIPESVWEGLVIEDNIMRFAGYGFMPAHARPDSRVGVAHFVGWTWNYNELPGDGVTIRNNIFDCSARNMVFWSGKTYEKGLSISGNSFYQKANMTGKAMLFAEYGQLNATNAEEFEAAMRAFDPQAKEIKWLS